MDGKGQNASESHDDFIRKYIWMVRPCEEYREEARECSSVKGRFHQYFIYGEFLDCIKWSQDLQNCEACLENKRNEACQSIIRHEVERRLKRISGAKQNDIWKRRDKPPENWNPPLSEYWLKKNEKSILLRKLDEYKEYVATHEPEYRSSCTIL